VTLDLDARTGRTAADAIRILLVEDDDIFARSLSYSLGQVGYQIHRAPDAAAATAALAARPDIALVDVSLGEGPNGFEVAEVLRSTTRMPIIFITAADSLTDRLAGFEVGADDYLVKPFEFRELLARMRAVLRRSGAVEPRTLHVGDLVLDETRKQVTVAGAPVNLTDTEFELLAALARSPGQVLSKVQLLSLVWGYEHYDTNLVEVHISALRRKLEGPGRRFIHTRRGRGYELIP
jgi:DNA-binding response OmpR family regulator